MDEEKKTMTEEELESVNGGGAVPNYDMWSMTVCVQSNYLALRPQPYWDQYHELAQMPNGATVYTSGQITNGTGLNGTPCQYMWVQYNGIQGWANAAFLR